MAPRPKSPPKKNMVSAVKAAIASVKAKDKKQDAAMMRKDEQKDKKMLVDAMRKATKK